MKNIIKLSFIIVLLLVVAVITGCQPTIQVIPDVLCSIEVTSPEHYEGLNGNETYEIIWNWVGPSNKNLKIILAGYTEDEDELGTMLIDSNVPAVDESYIWGPNFGVSIWTGFPEDWPWWFRVRIEVVGSEEVYGISHLFSVQWKPELKPE